MISIIRLKIKWSSSVGLSCTSSREPVSISAEHAVFEAAQWLGEAKSTSWTDNIGARGFRWTV